VDTTLAENVVDHLPEEHRAEVKRKLQNAYAVADYEDAKHALQKLHRELMDLNPSAARRLEEGLEETLTVHKLNAPVPLRKTLRNTIEAAAIKIETRVQRLPSVFVRCEFIVLHPGTVLLHRFPPRINARKRERVVPSFAWLRGCSYGLAASAG